MPYHSYSCPCWHLLRYWSWSFYPSCIRYAFSLKVVYCSHFNIFMNDLLAVHQSKFIYLSICFWKLLYVHICVDLPNCDSKWKNHLWELAWCCVYTGWKDFEWHYIYNLISTSYLENLSSFLLGSFGQVAYHVNNSSHSIDAFNRSVPG